MKTKSKTELSNELSDKEFVPTILLCLFVGGLGAHRFFVGKRGTGFAMIFTLGGLGIWVLIDLIRICFGTFRDVDGRIIKYQRAVVSSGVSAGEELEKFADLKAKGVRNKNSDDTILLKELTLKILDV